MNALVFAGSLGLFTWIFLAEAGVPLLVPTELWLVAGGVAAAHGLVSIAAGSPHFVPICSGQSRFSCSCAPLSGAIATAPAGGSHARLIGPPAELMQFRRPSQCGSRLRGASRCSACPPPSQPLWHRSRSCSTGSLALHAASSGLGFLPAAPIC